ncbi:reverse transcriptase [Plakobranchus ocellatus]|uniref:Reverse transcriptase n=1 Tax=Plakobranchus ocellatus TaxID=259542 RepID=A0AAV4DXE8_9GAST|nr:reverse transcriptase [Plakobranchus ocellatus]
MLHLAPQGFLWMISCSKEKRPAESLFGFSTEVEQMSFKSNKFGGLSIRKGKLNEDVSFKSKAETPTPLTTMFEDSEHPAMRSIQPQLKTGRKWRVDEAMNQAKKGLKIKEITGLTQTQGLVQRFRNPTPAKVMYLRVLIM